MSIITATPLAVRPVPQTCELQVWFGTDGETAVVLDRQRGHAVYVESSAIRVWIEDGGMAPVYEYLQFDRAEGMYVSQTRDEEGFRWVWLPRAGEGVRMVKVTVPFHRFGNEYHWNTREAIEAAFAILDARREARRREWYTVG